MRQEVLHAWKLKQARDLARKHAELMAEEAAKTGVRLRARFPIFPRTKSSLHLRLAFSPKAACRGDRRPRPPG